MSDMTAEEEAEFKLLSVEANKFLPSGPGRLGKWKFSIRVMLVVWKNGGKSGNSI